MDARTLSIQQAIATASRYSEQGLLEDESTSYPLTQAVPGNIAQLETYPSITSPPAQIADDLDVFCPGTFAGSRDPFRNTSSLQGSSGAIRTETRTSVNISGASVLANASHFEFGEGVKMSEGALSAVAKNQFILEQGDEEQPKGALRLHSLNSKIKIINSSSSLEIEGLNHGVPQEVGADSLSDSNTKIHMTGLSRSRHSNNQ
ncbi:hypothetical protein EV368DRAFT_85188 [Lentinula lateritia]|uniref:Uncharacterized protein n=1 Tax=Lentinula aff. lateritia TaxID=2804960 RepID=A0ACC1TTF1_9AGAR|nr:hypothetical protein F5876DRAFT_79535 [Lentinula aff. lateritia]KAJ3849782.1 hypothetical protein EV368DRAFT_85188 [Lentinula lateritia]